MKKKFWKLLIKKYKNKENIKRFIAEGISNVIVIVIVLIILYVLKLLNFKNLLF